MAENATTLLSTPEADEQTSRAWRLYRRFGFVDVLRDFRFPGDERPFGVLGRDLPLLPRPAHPSRTARDCRFADEHQARLARARLRIGDRYDPAQRQRVRRAGAGEHPAPGRFEAGDLLVELDAINREVLQPAGMTMRLVADDVGYVEDSLRNVWTNLALGAALASLVMFAFLRSVPATLVGVMGIQDVPGRDGADDVTLIRHAYVYTARPQVRLQDYGTFLDGSDVRLDWVSWAPAAGSDHVDIVALPQFGQVGAQKRFYRRLLHRLASL